MSNWLNRRDASIWIMVIINTVVVLAIYFESYKQFTSLMYGESAALVQSVSGQMAESLAPDLIAQNTELLQAEIRKVLNIRRIERVILRDNNGMILAEAGTKEAGPLNVSSPVEIRSSSGQSTYLGKVTVFYNVNHETKVVRHSGLVFLAWSFMALLAINVMILYRNAREKKYIEILADAFSSTLPDDQNITEEVRSLLSRRLGNKRAGILLEDLISKKIADSI